MRAVRTDCARVQIWTLQEQLLKLGSRVVGSVRRAVLHLPHSFPFHQTFQQEARAMGARAVQPRFVP